jgi:hypothetical protein
MTQIRTTQPSTEDYFKHNNITQKTINDATNSLIEISNMRDKEYYESYYTKALDEFLISLDYKGHKKIYSKILKKIGIGKNILESGYGSGILGCYIAKSNNQYKGIETNNFGYEMAKNRAKQNNLNPNIFELNNFFDYNNKHEILLTCKFLGGNNFQPNKDRIKKATEISSHIIGIEQIDFSDYEPSKLAQYKNEFKKHELNFEILHEPIMSNGNNSKYFLFEAKK